MNKLRALAELAALWLLITAALAVGALVLVAIDPLQPAQSFSARGSV